MKVQYFGDVNDYRKFALLRLLSEVGQFKIGVCWMLTADDGSGHGGKRGYLKQQEKWRECDPPMFGALTKAPPEPTISDLRLVEAEALIAGATFFNEFTPDSRSGRDSFHRQGMADFADSNLVFLDPHNGLEAKIPKGRKEIEQICIPGRDRRSARSWSTSNIRNTSRAKPTSPPPVPVCEPNCRAH